jgi:DNA replication initiation complex subunit (GINS family)
LKKEGRFKKAFALQEERIRIERERIEFKREMEEERIMNIDMSTLSYKQQQYYERRQDKIVAKCMNN